MVEAGDVDGDGIRDLAVGAHGDDTAGELGSGAFWLLYLEPDGSVRTQQKITQGLGGFEGDIVDDFFGLALALVDDYDGNGVEDLAVGAPGHSNTGALWILSWWNRPKVLPRPDAIDGSVDLVLPLTAAGTAPPMSAAIPRAGAEWQVSVDVSRHPTARFTGVWIAARGRDSRASALDVLLDTNTLLQRSIVRSAGSVDVHRIAIPPDLGGLSLYAQAGVLDAYGLHMGAAIAVEVR